MITSMKKIGTYSGSLFLALIPAILFYASSCSAQQRSTIYGYTADLTKLVAARSDFSEVEKKNISQLQQTLKADGISAEHINLIFGNKEFGLYDSVSKFFNKNPEKEADSARKTYKWYRQKHGIEKKIRDGKIFLNRHMNVLVGAEERYGVDKRYIVSILGVESDFSRYVGRYRAVNSFVTQYVHIRKRRNFALKQLKEIIRYAEKTNIPLFELRSSYAGAIGCGQFIPSSLNRLFIGQREQIEHADPFNTADCIYSISNYLKKSGWDKRQNNTLPARGSKNWKAIRAYNHSDNYTKLIIEVAESLKKSKANNKTDI
jgi:membrane-bound lytic murein transglycosylase B